MHFTFIKHSRHLGRIPTYVNTLHDIYIVLLWTFDHTTRTHIVQQWCIFCRKWQNKNDIICAISNTDGPCLKKYTQIFICKRTDLGRICRSNLIFHFECCKEYLYVSDCVMAIIMNKVMLFPYWHNNAEQKTSNRYLNNHLHDVLCLLSFV